MAQVPYAFGFVRLAARAVTDHPLGGTAGAT
jgi:hypothetical protein